MMDLLMRKTQNQVFYRWALNVYFNVIYHACVLCMFYLCNYIVFKSRSSPFSRKYRRGYPKLS